ncbi:MAG TPA: MFS transporter [Solirubrobacteraceae bacterium]|jgi:predicted MFS family arabinose efflux permease
MRRLLALTTALMFLELVFFTVLSPLLPGLKHDLDLSTSQAGVLVAMYAVGCAVGAIPSLMIVVRLGVRRTALVALATFATMSLLFGLAHGYDALLAARFVQGLAGAACWTAAMLWLLETAPLDRRGELLGIAFGVSEAGAIAGPAAGGIAAAAGRGPTFAAIAGLCAVLGLVIARVPAPRAPAEKRLGLGVALSSRNVRKVMWITLLPATLLAAISVLAPLQQHRLGAGSGEIAATFAAAAVLGIAIQPFYGRWSDRSGPLRPVRFGLLACAPVVVALPWMQTRFGTAALVVVALILVDVLWAPVMVMLSDATTAVGMGQLMVVAMMDLTWPPGNIVGSAGGGALAQVVGQHVTYAVMAALLLAGCAALSGRRAPAQQAAVADGLSVSGT